MLPQRNILSILLVFILSPGADAGKNLVTKLIIFTFNKTDDVQFCLLN